MSERIRAISDIARFKRLAVIVFGALSRSVTVTWKHKLSLAYIVNVPYTYTLIFTWFYTHAWFADWKPSAKFSHVIILIRF